MDFVTIGRSVSVHAVDIEIEVFDHAGLLQDVLGVAGETKTQISSVNARVKRDKSALISMTAQINDLDHLQVLLRKLGGIREVRNVWRVTKREAKATS